MAQTHITQLTDDFDGSEAIVTRQFGLDGKFYEIDLNEEHNTTLDEALAEFIEVARKLKASEVKLRAARGTGSSTSASGHSKEYNAQVRAWAQENDFEVAERGRIPAHVYEAFEAAN